MSASDEPLPCPRCGGSQEGRGFYGPCLGCVAQLRCLTPPKADHKNYKRSTTLSGHEMVNYVGPRTEVKS